jgi:hypothetical protein
MKYHKNNLFCKMRRPKAIISPRSTQSFQHRMVVLPLSDSNINERLVQILKRTKKNFYQYLLLHCAEILSLNKRALPNEEERSEIDFRHLHEYADAELQTRKDDEDTLLVQKVKEYGSFDKALKYMSKIGIEYLYRHTVGNMREYSMQEYIRITDSCDAPHLDYDYFYMILDEMGIFMFHIFDNLEHDTISTVFDDYVDTVAKPYFDGLKEVFQTMEESSKA